MFKRMHESADFLSIGLSTGSKNLAYDLRREVLAVALEDAGIPYRCHQAIQPFDLFDQVKALGNDDVVAYFGEDQHRLAKVAERHYGWDSATIERLTSSTALRVAIDQEDWDMVANLTIPGTASHLINLRKLELTD